MTGIRVFLAFVLGLTAGCDAADGDAMYGDAVPPDMLGRSVTVTLVDSDNPAAAIPGTVIVYRFLSNTRVLGDGQNTLATQSWTYSRDGGNDATVKLEYGERSFEQYMLRFDAPEGGSCSFHYEAAYIGPTPSGDPDEVVEYNGTCDFQLDTTCADLTQVECDSTTACRWDDLDPALPACVPEAVAPDPSCPDYTGPTSAPQRDAQCKAAWAADCGGVSSEPYCEIYNDASWGAAGSCPYC